MTRIQKVARWIDTAQRKIIDLCILFYKHVLLRIWRMLRWLIRLFNKPLPAFFATFATLLGFLTTFPHISITVQNTSSARNPLLDLFVIGNDGLLPIYDGRVALNVRKFQWSPVKVDLTQSCDEIPSGRDAPGDDVLFKELEPGDRQSYQPSVIVDTMFRGIPSFSTTEYFAADIAIDIDYSVLPIEKRLWRRHTTRHFFSGYDEQQKASWFYCANGHWLRFDN